MAATSGNSSLHPSMWHFASLDSCPSASSLSPCLSFSAFHQTPTALKQQPAMRNQKSEAYQGERLGIPALMALAFTNIYTQDKKFITWSGNRIYISPHSSAFCPWCWCFVVPPTWTWVCKNFPLQSKNKQLLWLLLGRKLGVTTQYLNTPLQVLSMSGILYNSTIISIQNFPRPFWNRN